MSSRLFGNFKIRGPLCLFLCPELANSWRKFGIDFWLSKFGIQTLRETNHRSLEFSDCFDFSRFNAVSCSTQQSRIASLKAATCDLLEGVMSRKLRFIGLRTPSEPERFPKKSLPLKPTVREREAGQERSPKMKQIPSRNRLNVLSDMLGHKFCSTKPSWQYAPKSCVKQPHSLSDLVTFLVSFI